MRADAINIADVYAGMSYDIFQYHLADWEMRSRV